MPLDPLDPLDTALEPSDDAAERPAPIGASADERARASVAAEALLDPSTSEAPHKRHGDDGFHCLRMLAAATAATIRVRTTAATMRPALPEWITGVYLSEPELQRNCQFQSDPGVRLNHFTAIGYGAAVKCAPAHGEVARKIAGINGSLPAQPGRDDTQKLKKRRKSIPARSTRRKGESTVNDCASEKVARSLNRRDR